MTVFERCDDRLVADELVFAIAADRVDPAHAELLERGKRIISDLGGSTEDQQVVGLRNSPDVLELPEPRDVLTVDTAGAGAVRCGAEHVNAEAEGRSERDR